MQKFLTYLMSYDHIPEQDKQEMRGMEDAIIHANVDTFATEDSMPGEKPIPSDALWISVFHDDNEKLQKAFDAMAEEGDHMPLGETFFSPFHGQVKTSMVFVG